VSSFGVGREPALAGQTVVVIGGSLGIGLETGRQARAEGAKVILTGRDPERLKSAARETGATSSVAFDATDFERLGKFFDELSAPIDHVLVTGPGPYYAPLAEFDAEKARRDVEAHLLCRCRSRGTPRARFALEGPCSSWAARAAGERRWE
jgi:NAD(P)-dependent dehydrogenase (short-subunit alcohol dehydrogenase family)